MGGLGSTLRQAMTVCSVPPSVNIHHLELFYHVARHGGISAAVRHMPYGIQQPAVSSQILQLEENLGVKLFERSPFKLTAAGEELAAFVRPFFENLAPVAERLRVHAGPLLRVGASELVLRSHLPAVIQQFKRDHPELRLALRSGFQHELEVALRDREIDLAIIPLRGRPPAQTRCLRVMHLPLVLLVHKKSRIKSAAELWTKKRPAELLISLPPTESISQLFQQGLKRRGVTWPLAIEASSMELVTQYVANGDGVGVNIAIPNVVRHPQVRVLPLDGFDRLVLAMLWRGAPTPLIRAVLAAAQQYVVEQWPDWASGEKLPA
jgi:DNA-binding transcriptional LysR family regulator